MTSDPTLEEQELLADTLRRRDARRMTVRERLATLVTGPGFFGAAAALWWLAPPHHIPVLPAVLCVAVTALATRVLFDTPFGFTVATQIAFVPMLFSLPLAVVPPAFAVAFALSGGVDIATGERSVASLLRVPGNCWSAVFPTLVFALAGTPVRQASPALLVVALAAQFTGDFVQASLYTAVTRRVTLRAQLRETWVYLIDAALSGVGLIVGEQMHVTPFALLAIVPLLGLLAMFARERQGRLGNLLELNDTYRGTALLLGDVIAADDGYTGEHSHDVVDLALAVGERLGLSPERRRNLEFAALLHDVGKIAIPKEILNKPGKLTPEEWEVMKTHSAEGERMLNRVGGFMCDVGTIVRSHHERWDGGGYPDGLIGDTIPLEARIITACDSWSAMRTDRVYREALSQQAALGEMVAHAGRQFDVDVVRAILQVVEPRPAEGAGPAAGPAAGAAPAAGGAASTPPLPRPAARSSELVSGAGA